jgi:hypothetical protein
VLKWSQKPEEAPARLEPGRAGSDPAAGGVDRSLRGSLDRAWRAWLREWSVFTPRWADSGDWELV